MADIDWRLWLKTKVSALVLPLGIATEQVYAAGSVDENPKVRPFIVIYAGPELRGPFPGTSRNTAQIWVHDEPGTYMTIDAILAALKTGLNGAVTDAGGVSCRWIGHSTELADEGYKTITRNTSYQLNGKDASNAG